MIIGSHVSFGSEQILGSVKEAISYGANTFMFYTGAPQNTMRKEIDENLTKEAQKLMLANNIAVIDADYKGEIWLPLFNFSDKEVVVTKGTRVAQGIFLEYNTLGDIVTQQRTGGIGSTN